MARRSRGVRPSSDSDKSREQPGVLRSSPMVARCWGWMEELPVQVQASRGCVVEVANHHLSSASSTGWHRSSRSPTRRSVGWRQPSVPRVFSCRAPPLSSPNISVLTLRSRLPRRSLRFHLFREHRSCALSEIARDGTAGWNADAS